MKPIHSYKEFKKYHESKNKQSLHSPFQITMGDYVAIWDEELNRQVVAELVDRDWDNDLVLKPLELCPWTRKTVNPLKHTIYRVNPNEIINLKDCECGARHTSFPNIHLFYCKLYRSG